MGTDLFLGGGLGATFCIGFLVFSKCPSAPGTLTFDSTGARMTYRILFFILNSLLLPTIVHCHSHIVLRKATWNLFKVLTLFSYFKKAPVYPHTIFIARSRIILPYSIMWGNQTHREHLRINNIPPNRLVELPHPVKRHRVVKLCVVAWYCKARACKFQIYSHKTVFLSGHQPRVMSRRDQNNFILA